MEYRSIRYTLRARIERAQWYVALYPMGVEMKGRVVFGSREEAELRARAMINDWLKRRPTQNPKSKLTPTFLRNHGGEEELPLLSSGR